MKKIIVIMGCLILSLAAEEVRDDEVRYDGLVCYRFLGVTGPASFRCDIVKPYPNTLLHPLMRKGIVIKVRGIRIADINATSKKERELALQTEEFLKETLPGVEVIRLSNVGRDTSFRLLADVYIDEQDLKTILVDKELACKEEDIAHVKRFAIKKIINKGGEGLKCPQAPPPKKAKKTKKVKKPKEPKKSKKSKES